MAERNDGMENEVAAFVLDALDTQEEAAVRAHLASCASCRQLEQRLRRVLGSLPLAAEEAVPPPRLRERVLAAAGASPQAVEPRPRAVALRPHRPRPRSRRPWVATGLVAALIAVIVLAGWNVYLTQELRSVPRGQPTAVTTSAIRPTSAGTIAGAQGEVIQVSSQGLAVVQFSNLPVPAPGRVYQLWVGPSAGHVKSAGVFLPESDGSKVLVLDQGLAQDRLIAVTLEPAPDGSSAPTQAPGMVGKL